MSKESPDIDYFVDRMGRGEKPQNYKNWSFSEQFDLFIPDRGLHESTRQEYLKIMESFMNEFVRDLYYANEWWHEMHDFPNFMESIALNEDWAPSTFRLYRAAVVWVFEGLGMREKYIEQLRNLPRGTDDEDGNKKKDRDVVKVFPGELHRELIELLENNTHGGAKWHSPLADWLAAGLWTGLRPKEWSSAQLIDEDGPVLRVENGKYEEGVRAFGPTRRLRLRMTDEQLQTIDRLTDRLNSETYDEFKSKYNCSRVLLWRKIKKIRPSWTKDKRPSLYSLRHQFTSNMKSRDFTDVEIAAMLGHRSVDTAEIHYGYTVSGSGGTSLVRPDPENVERVAEIHNLDLDELNLT